MFRSELRFVLALSFAALSTFGAEASSFKVLHIFSQSGDGDTPFAGLFMDIAGNLYGTTIVGGAHGRGTLFRITPDGQEEIVYSFGAGTDAAWPDTELTADVAGNLYGGSDIGGEFGSGTVFRISLDGAGQVLHVFGPGGDGANPRGTLVFDQTGNLYGTTASGGAGRNCGGSGCGTIFKLAPDRTETVLYRFTGDDDGNGPQGDLVLDAHGRLFGTTFAGGSARCGQQWGCGTMFTVDPDGTTKVLFRFNQREEGHYPVSGLIADEAGNFYGATWRGGTGYGTIFKIDRHGVETVLHAFDKVDGAQPNGGLLLDQKGNLYGVTRTGGSNDFGTLFELKPGGDLVVLHNFDQRTANPVGRFVMDAQGYLYGTTSSTGPAGNNGAVYRLRP